LLLHVPAFPTDPSGHGGNQRSAQVAEFLTTVHPVSTIDKHRQKKAVPRPEVLFRAASLARRFPRQAASLGRMLLRKLEMERDSVVATEQYYWNVPAFLRYVCEFRTIVFPQNIESMVPRQSRKLHKVQERDFELECMLLNSANCCVCISAEDCDAVRPYVKRVFTLPYFPANQRLKKLLEVREERQRTRIRNIVLVLGSATNPPTRMGMEELLSSLNSQLLKQMNGLEVVVAGHGTESLRQHQRDGVSVEGSVSSERLIELQRHAHCQVINHVSTTGALTRVVEAVCCGIPVIGNTYASRGYRELSGLTVVNSSEEIWRRIVELPLNHIPPVPQPPRADEAILRDFLQKEFGLSEGSYRHPL
jgi:hypothetical protein